MTTLSKLAGGRRTLQPVLHLGVLAAALLLSACGGGGGNKNPGNNNGSLNVAPTANAGGDRTVTELTLVNLNGSGSDVNGDTLSFAWAQTGGTAVTLSTLSAAQTSFTAPDVAAGSPETLTFALTVSDGTASSTDSVEIVVQEPGDAARVFGTVRYEFVPANPGCFGLNFTVPPEQRPIRGATVQLIDDATGAVLASTVADAGGNYAFDNQPTDTLVRLRVRAELKKLTGAPRWDVDVRDNVVAPDNTGPLSSRALYAVESTAFDSGSGDTQRNLLAETGWTGTGYTQPRAAAPFAVLDAIYTAIQFVLSVDPTATFPALDAYWSPDNTGTVNGELDDGEIGGAAYYSTDPDGDGIPNPGLVLAGDASDNTVEFDAHIVVHEWGHYFEDNFSRSDSPGGTHFLGDRIDARLAFGEGWAHAFAAMAFNDPVACNTGPAGSAGGFELNAEGGPSFGAPGWFDETSVMRALFDIWDVDEPGSDGSDTDSLGFQSIYDVMTGSQIQTEAFTTIFSFATLLKAVVDQAGDDLVDSQLTDEDIGTAINIWGDGETNQSNAMVDVLPVYIPMTANGSVENICSNSQFDPRAEMDGNKLSEYRYIRLNVPATDRYDVSIQASTIIPPTPDPDDRDQSDPDMIIQRADAVVAFGFSPDANSEIFRTQTLTPGTYVADLRDWRFADPEIPNTYPSVVCFDVSFTPTP